MCVCAGVCAAGGGVSAQRRAGLHQQRGHVDGGRVRGEEPGDPAGQHAHPLRPAGCGAGDGRLELSAPAGPRPHRRWGH